MTDCTKCAQTAENAMKVYGLTLDILKAVFTVKIPPPKFNTKHVDGSMRCRHYSNPEMFDETGNWRPGVDRFAFYRTP